MKSLEASREIETLLGKAIGLDARSIGSSLIALAAHTRSTKRQIKNLSEYIALVASSETELQALVEEIVVPETWFFRDRQPFTVLAEWVVNEWLPAHPWDVLRVLSAPCSSGEEPYSIVMTLLEAGLSPDRFTVEAVDISAVALQKARTGLYSRNSFRGQRLEMREKYFQETPAGWQLQEEVRKQVKFRHANLLGDALLCKAGRLDVVFCRNMLIYFDDDSRRRVIAKLTGMLTPQGMLFLGHAEGGIARSFGFESIPAPMAFAFRRTTGTPEPAEPEPRARKAAVRAPVKAPQPMPVPLLPTPLPRRVAVKQPAPEAPVTAEARLAQAHRLADVGKFDEARTACETCLSQHGPSSGAYYLLGLIHDAEGREAQAQESYRKTLYLEPDHHEALFQLALLAKKGGDTKNSRQLHERAVRAQAKSTAKTKAS